jgi:hypothetical protein
MVGGMGGRDLNLFFFFDQARDTKLSRSGIYANPWTSAARLQLWRVVTQAGEEATWEEILRSDYFLISSKSLGAGINSPRTLLEA